MAHKRRGTPPFLELPQSPGDVDPFACRDNTSVGCSHPVYVLTTSCRAAVLVRGLFVVCGVFSTHLFNPEVPAAPGRKPNHLFAACLALGKQARWCPVKGIFSSPVSGTFQASL